MKDEIVKTTRSSTSLMIAVLACFSILGGAGCASITSKLMKPRATKPLIKATDHDHETHTTESPESYSSQSRTESDRTMPVRHANGARQIDGAVVPASYLTPATQDETVVYDGGYESYSLDGHIVPPDASYLDTQYCSDEAMGGCEGCGSCASCSLPTRVPRLQDVQEYVFDGGDQQPTVVIKKDWTADGIDPTDTVVYYETENGEVCVRPTNRVPIYAPRFGAVRQITGAIQADRSVGTQRILAPVQAGRIDEAYLASTVTQPLAPHGEAQVNLIDAFQENTGGQPLDGILPPQRMSEALVPFEGIEVIGTGRITDEEIAVLGRVIQNARTWFVPESLGITIDNQPAALIQESVKPQDVHIYEIPGKCSLRICKTASHTIANSGDIVNFSIRFDNAGTKPVGNVVIVDSLSARLEYIDGSQQSSVGTRFTVSPNEVGSQVLKWEIELPIQKSEGGVISFDCRVR